MPVHIDNTSLFGLAMAYSVDSIPLWAFNSFSDITCLMLKADEVSVSPPESAKYPPNVLIAPIFRVAKHAHFEKPRRDKAEDRASKRIERELPGICAKYLSLLNNKDEADSWLDWHITFEWAEHIKRLGGMIEEKNAENVSRMSGLEQKEIEELNLRCRAASLNDVIDIRKLFDQNEVESLKKMFTADVLLRGISYEELARLHSSKLVLHSTRRYVAESQRVGKIITATRTISILAAMIGNYARQEHKPENRLQKYADSVSRVRQLVAGRQLAEEAEPISEAEATNEATTIMKEALLIPRWELGRMMEGPFSILLGKVMCLVFSQLLPEGQVASMVSEIEPIVDIGLYFPLHLGMRSVEMSDWNIIRFANSGAGRVFSGTDVFKAIQP
jgi:hypothetical protein